MTRTLYHGDCPGCGERLEDPDAHEFCSDHCEAQYNGLECDEGCPDCEGGDE